jgi:hypothetical protein
MFLGKQSGRRACPRKRGVQLAAERMAQPVLAPDKMGGAIRLFNGEPIPG